MIDDLLTEENVWDRLRREGKPLVLYGMGDGAEKINAVLESKGMHITAVFASDDFVRGQSFLGHTVQRYREVCAQFTDFMWYWALPASARRYWKTSPGSIESTRCMHRIFRWPA